MTRKNQKVQIDYEGSYGKFLNQDITDIVVDAEGYAFGRWNGKLVGSFSLKSDTWFNI